MILLNFYEMICGRFGNFMHNIHISLTGFLYNNFALYSSRSKFIKLRHNYVNAIVRFSLKPVQHL